MKVLNLAVQSDGFFHPHIFTCTRVSGLPTSHCHRAYPATHCSTVHQPRVTWVYAHAEPPGVHPWTINNSVEQHKSNPNRSRRSLLAVVPCAPRYAPPNKALRISKSSVVSLFSCSGIRSTEYHHIVVHPPPCIYNVVLQDVIWTVACINGRAGRCHTTKT